MTPQDLSDLLKYMELLCPASAIDENAFLRWGVMIGKRPWSLDDAKAGAEKVATRQRHIEPHDLIDEVERIRDERLGRTPLIEPPNDGGDDGRYRQELNAAIKRIADGWSGGPGSTFQLPPALPGDYDEPMAPRASDRAQAKVNGWTEEFTAHRALALGHPDPCEACGAVTGRGCRLAPELGGELLVTAPAHWSRMARVGLVQPARPLTEADKAFLLAADSQGHGGPESHAEAFGDDG